MGILEWILLGIGIVLLLIICFCLSVASFSYENFKIKQENAQKYHISADLTVKEFVQKVNHDYLRKELSIELCDEDCDHYSAGVIALSESTLASESLSSFSIIAHEMGHAVQFEKGELTRHWRAKAKRRILGRFFVPMIVLGIIMSVFYLVGLLGLYSLIIGFVFFGLALIIFGVAIYAKYKEIQVEKGASDYGIEMMKEYMTPVELKICTEFLNSARLTYWGSLFRTMFGWLGISQKDELFN